MVVWLIILGMVLWWTLRRKKMRKRNEKSEERATCVSCGRRWLEEVLVDFFWRKGKRIKFVSRKVANKLQGNMKFVVVKRGWVRMKCYWWCMHQLHVFKKRRQRKSELRFSNKMQVVTWFVMICREKTSVLTKEDPLDFQTWKFSFHLGCHLEIKDSQSVQCPYGSWFWKQENRILVMYWNGLVAPMSRWQANRCPPVRVQVIEKQIVNDLRCEMEGSNHPNTQIQRLTKPGMQTTNQESFFARRSRLSRTASLKLLLLTTRTIFFQGGTALLVIASFWDWPFTTFF